MKKLNIYNIMKKFKIFIKRDQGREIAVLTLKIKRKKLPLTVMKELYGGG